MEKRKPGEDDRPDAKKPKNEDGGKLKNSSSDSDGRNFGFNEMEKSLPPVKDPCRKSLLKLSIPTNTPTSAQRKRKEKWEGMSNRRPSRLGTTNPSGTSSSATKGNPSEVAFTTTSNKPESGTSSSARKGITSEVAFPTTSNNHESGDSDDEDVEKKKV